MFRLEEIRDPVNCHDCYRCNIVEPGPFFIGTTKTPCSVLSDINIDDL